MAATVDPARPAGDVAAPVRPAREAVGVAPRPAMAGAAMDETPAAAAPRAKRSRRHTPGRCVERTDTPCAGLRPEVPRGPAEQPWNGGPAARRHRAAS